MLKIVRINLLILITLVLFTELAGQLIANVKNNKFLFADYEIQGRHNLFIPHPYLPVALNKNVNQNFNSDRE